MEGTKYWTKLHTRTDVGIVNITNMVTERKFGGAKQHLTYSTTPAAFISYIN